MKRRVSKRGGFRVQGSGFRVLRCVSGPVNPKKICKKLYAREAIPHEVGHFSAVP